MLKPQDILVALAILFREDSTWRQIDIAQEIGVSASEVNAAIKRLMFARLLYLSPTTSKHIVNVTSLKEFLIHGLKYVYPVEIGPITRGVPTGYAAPGFKGMLVHKEEDIPVWPDAQGPSRGYAITPIYDTVSRIKNEKIHQFLAAIDMIRIGRARERGIAIQYIEEKLDEYHTA